jgi:hypothetical protein
MADGIDDKRCFLVRGHDENFEPPLTLILSPEGERKQRYPFSWRGRGRE